MPDVGLEGDGSRARLPATHKSHVSVKGMKPEDQRPVPKVKDQIPAFPVHAKSAEATPGELVVELPGDCGREGGVPEYRHGVKVVSGRGSTKWRGPGARECRQPRIGAEQGV